MYHNYLKRKEKVIISAIDLLDEAGIQGLTTKELAKREGISEPALYRQFDSKQDIILTILERFAAYDDMIINTVTEQNMQPVEGIFYFAEAYAGYYQSYPQIATVLFSFDIYRYDTKTNELMKKILEKLNAFLSELIQRGQEMGELDSQISANELSKMIIGLIWSSTFQWKFFDYKEDLKKMVLNSLQWVLRG